MMTNKRRYFLTIVSLSVGMIISLLIFYLKKGKFDNHTWLSYGTVFTYSLLIVLGIGWYLQRKSKKDKKNSQ